MPSCDRGCCEDVWHHRAAQGFSGQESAGVHRFREGQIPARSISAMRGRLVEFSDLQEFYPGRRHRRDLVGYRGGAPALTDAIGGQIDGSATTQASVSQAIDDRLVKAPGDRSTVRLATLRTCRHPPKAGLPEFEAQGWNGLFAPRARRRRSSQSSTPRRRRRGKRRREKALPRFVVGAAGDKRTYAGGVASSW